MVGRHQNMRNCIRKAENHGFDPSQNPVHPLNKDYPCSILLPLDGCEAVSILGTYLFHETGTTEKVSFGV